MSKVWLFLFSSSLLFANPYENILTSKFMSNKASTLSLFQEADTEFPDKNALVEILLPDGRSLSYTLPFTVHTAVKTPKELFDIDGDGQMELILEGYSPEPIGESPSLFCILTLEEMGIHEKIPCIKASNSYSFKYLKKEGLLIFAQNIQRIGIESRLGDSYTYAFYLYDGHDGLVKRPILLSDEKLDSEEGMFIESYLPKILAKYKDYKEGQLSAKKLEEIEAFVQKYWKERAKNSPKNIIFTLNEFLIYKKEKNYIIEYTKHYTIDDYTAYGSVKSSMILGEKDKQLFVKSEKEFAVLSLSSDGK